MDVVLLGYAAHIESSKLIYKLDFTMAAAIQMHKQETKNRTQHKTLNIQGLKKLIIKANRRKKKIVQLLLLLLPLLFSISV